MNESGNLDAASAKILAALLRDKHQNQKKAAKIVRFEDNDPKPEAMLVESSTN